jgi:hypothetical protein
MIGLWIWLAIQIPLAVMIGKGLRSKRKFDEVFRHG